MARPTKATPELAERAKAYVEGEYLNDGDVIPSVVGMALYLGVGVRTLHDWKEQDRQGFSHILEQCLAKQHKITLNGGLKNEFNANICKLLLGKHGYKDQAETDNKHTIDKNVKDMSNEELASIASGSS